MSYLCKHARFLIWSYVCLTLGCQHQPSSTPTPSDKRIAAGIEEVQLSWEDVKEAELSLMARQMLLTNPLVLTDFRGKFEFAVGTLVGIEGALEGVWIEAGAFTSDCLVSINFYISKQTDPEFAQALLESFEPESSVVQLMQSVRDEGGGVIWSIGFQVAATTVARYVTTLTTPSGMDNGHLYGEQALAILGGTEGVIQIMRFAKGLRGISLLPKSPKIPFYVGMRPAFTPAFAGAGITGGSATGIAVGAAPAVAIAGSIESVRGPVLAPLIASGEIEWAMKELREGRSRLVEAELVAQDAVLAGKSAFDDAAARLTARRAHDRMRAAWNEKNLGTAKWKDLTAEEWSEWKTQHPDLADKIEICEVAHDGTTAKVNLALLNFDDLPLVVQLEKLTNAQFAVQKVRARFEAGRALSDENWLTKASSEVHNLWLGWDPVMGGPSQLRIYRPLTDYDKFRARVFVEEASSVWNARTASGSTPAGATLEGVLWDGSVLQDKTPNLPVSITARSDVSGLMRSRLAGATDSLGAPKLSAILDHPKTQATVTESGFKLARTLDAEELANMSFAPHLKEVQIDLDFPVIQEGPAALSAQSPTQVRVKFSMNTVRGPEGEGVVEFFKGISSKSIQIRMDIPSQHTIVVRAQKPTRVSHLIDPSAPTAMESILTSLEEGLF